MLEYPIVQFPPPPPPDPPPPPPSLRATGRPSRWRAFLRGAAYTNPVRDLLDRWRTTPADIGRVASSRQPSKRGATEAEFVTLRVDKWGFGLVRKDGTLLELPFADLNDLHFVGIYLYRWWVEENQQARLEEVCFRAHERSYRIAVLEPLRFDDYVRTVVGRLTNTHFQMEEGGARKVTTREANFSQFTHRYTYRVHTQEELLATTRRRYRQPEQFNATVRVPVSAEMGGLDGEEFELWGSRVGLRVVRSGHTLFKIEYTRIAQFQFNGCIYFTPVRLLTSHPSTLNYSELFVETHDGTPYTFYIRDLIHPTSTLKYSLEAWMDGTFVPAEGKQAFQASVKLSKGAAVARIVEEFHRNVEGSPSG